MKIGLEGNQKDKEECLHCLVDFIEDCQYDYLSTNILDFVANQAEFTSNPSFYIRYIYNRVILEKAQIRAAAVTALGTIGSRI